MSKVDIISGFLGAGKTTLIKKLLKEALNNEQVVLIENEFGEIGIDSGFLNEAGVEIKEMNQGCICCSLVGDFSEALKNVLTEYKPDRVIIEPSGVGKLSDVIKAVKDISDDVDIDLNSFVTVVDVMKCNVYMKNFGEFYNDQIETADCIVLSRSQNIDKGQLDEIIHNIKELNSNARIVTTPWNEIDGKILLEAMEQSKTLEEILLDEETVCPDCGHHHHHEHDENCECGGHDREEHHHHHHEHNESCECGCHHHEHDENCGCGGHDHEEHHHHHHEHNESCECGCHHHEHDENCECEGHQHEEHHHHHHADDVFTSWGVETTKVFDKNKLDKILKILSNNEAVLRAKGMLETTDGSWVHFDLVQGSYEIRVGNPDYTGRICVIGTTVEEEAMRKLFEME